MVAEALKFFKMIHHRNWLITVLFQNYQVDQNRRVFSDGSACFYRNEMGTIVDF